MKLDWGRKLLLILNVNVTLALEAHHVVPQLFQVLAAHNEREDTGALCQELLLELLLGLRTVCSC